ncbi:MAG TPA: DUF6152 family protein [Gammaproteobacteria bacterium]|nr:DUF6152 family protein [Gammaproteobacteria bacterium]
MPFATSSIIARGAALGIAAAAALASAASSAHHSPAVFDGNRKIVVEGVVTSFRWAQPHSWIHMNVTDETGAIRDWTIEMDPASNLRQRGWTARTVRPGDRIAVTVHPLRSGQIGGQYVSVKLPSGEVMDASYTEPKVLDD